MVMRIFGGCSALFALFALIIFGLEMSIATTESGTDPSAGIARKGDRLVPALHLDPIKRPPAIGGPSAPASRPAVYDGCELLASSLALLPSEQIAARCLT
jgi:hypothetical protein